MQNLLDIQEQCICKLGKLQSEEKNYAFIFEFFFFLIQNLLDIQEQCICKLGKLQSELKHFYLVFIIDF